MDAILGKHVRVTDLARDWVSQRPALMLRWLEGVNSFDGRPAIGSACGDGAGPFDLKVRELGLYPQDSGRRQHHAVRRVHEDKMRAAFFDAISLTLGGSIAAVDGLLRGIPAPVLIGGIALLAWVLRRSVGLAVFIVASLLFIMNQGYWDATLETLSLVLVAALIATLIGVPLGIAAAKRPRLYAAMRPVLDLMQTLPTFVYLTPTLVLFGLGRRSRADFHDHFRAAGADPADAARHRVGADDAARSRAGVWRDATAIAGESGVTQRSANDPGRHHSVHHAESLDGRHRRPGRRGGLGVPVVRALNTVQVGMGFEAGIAIVLLAIILDRISRPAERNDHR